MDVLAGKLSLSSAVLIAAVSFFLYTVARAIYNVVWHPLAGLPGRKTWGASRLPFVWALVRGRVVMAIEELHRQHGPVVRVAPDEVAYADPDAWADILQARAGSRPFPKDETWWTPMPGAAPGLITAVDHDLHAALRRQLSPGFTSRAMRGQEEVVHRYVDVLVERWREMAASGRHGEIDVVRWFNFLTFDIFGELAFGESFDCLRRSEYHSWIAVIFDNLKFTGAVITARFYVPHWVASALSVLVPPYLARAARAHAQHIVDRVRRRLDGGGSQRLDFMSGVQAALETKARDAVAMDVVNSTFAELATAGSETTAMALSAAVNLLVHNPDQMETLRTEIRRRFRAYHDITAQAARDLPYLNGFIHETLRLCPPVPWMPPRRVPEGGGTVCGQWLPGGTRVSITFTSMHQSPDSFHDASSLRPERWLPEAARDPGSPFYRDKRHAFQPFAVGPHSCIGQNLAWVKLRVGLAKLLWVFDFERPRDQRKWVSWASLRVYGLIEKSPIRVVVKERGNK